MLGKPCCLHRAQTGTGLPGTKLEQGVDTPSVVAFPEGPPPPKPGQRGGGGYDPGAYGAPRKLVSLGAGNFHSAAVDERGRLFTWGNGRHGECGHPSENVRGQAGGAAAAGPDREEEPRPRRVTLPPEALALTRGRQPHFRRVCCGMYHTLALAEGGLVFAWGSNSVGQLGLGKFGPLSTSRPLLVEVARNENELPRHTDQEAVSE